MINRKKIAIKIFVVGLILGLVLCGIGFFIHMNAKKTKKENYDSAMTKVSQIDREIQQLNSEISKLEDEKDELVMGDDNWFSENKRLGDEIFDLKSEVNSLTYERNCLENKAEFENNSNSGPHIVFYGLGFWAFVILSFTALIYYLVTLEK